MDKKLDLMIALDIYSSAILIGVLYRHYMYAIDMQGIE